jgi:hypothetical protein
VLSGNESGLLSGSIKGRVSVYNKNIYIYCLEYECMCVKYVIWYDSYRVIYV